MKRLLAILAIAVVLFSSSTAYGKYGLKPYSFTVVDEFRNTVTDSVTMTVYIAGSSAATVYSDANKTAIGTTLTAVTDGVFTFWYGPTTCDIKVTNNSTGNAVKVSSLAPTDHSIMLSRNEAVLSATTYTGTVTGVGSAWTGDMDLGVDGTGVDVTFYGDTASDYMLWDQNAQTNGVLIFEDTGACYNDATRVRFGDGASAGAGDLYLSTDSSAVLTFGQVVSGTGTFVLGADGKGIDTTFYAETASDKMWWDQDGSTNVGALTFANSAVLFDQATVDYTLVAASNALSLTATDNASAAFTLGSTGTNGLDVIFQSITSGDYIKFDAGAIQLQFVDADALFQDTADLIMGSDSDFVIECDAAKTLEILPGADASSVIFGDGTTDTDIQWFASAVGDYVLFDESAAQVDFLDIDLRLDDDATLKIGTGADMTFDSDGTIVTVAGSYDLTTTDAGIDITTNTNKTHKYAYAGIGYIGATSVSVTGWGSADGLAQTGLAAGVAESFAAEGYTMIDDAADFLLVSIPVPALFVDNGNAADLVLEFDLHEQAAEECNIDIRVFEYGNTTPIVTDTVVIANGAARAWSGLVTLSSGIGAVGNLDADDILLIEITINADTDDLDVYGVRLKYNVGIEATQ